MSSAPAYYGTVFPGAVVRLRPGDEIMIHQEGTFRAAEVEYLGAQGDYDCIIVVTLEDGTKQELRWDEIG